VSPVKYKLGFYIPEDDILHSHRRGNKSYTVLGTFINNLLTTRPANEFLITISTALTLLDGDWRSRTKVKGK
jgi:hypothetical protein